MMAQSRGSASAGPRFCLCFRDRGCGTRAAKDGNIGRNDAAGNKGNCIMETTREALRFVVINSKTGAHLREATASEVQLFWHYQLDRRAVPGSECFARCVRINSTESVDIYTGPGQWFSGAGF